MAIERATAQKVVDDFATALKDAEVLLEEVGSEAGERAVNARARLEEKLRQAKLKLGELEEAVAERTRAAARITDDYVHEHPWRAIGVSAGIGFLIGLLVNRR